MLYWRVMVEKSDNVKRAGELSIVINGADICDLPGLKRHIFTFFGQTRLIRILFTMRYAWMYTSQA